MTNGRFDVGGDDRSLWQKIRDVALTDVSTLVKGIDEETITELERVLLESDFGVDATMELVDDLERAAERGKVSTEEELRRHLAGRILELLRGAAADGTVDADDGAGPDGSSVELARPTDGPSVVLVLGVNGAGKTTTVAKLAHRYRAWREGPVLAAADTFRAGAQNQLRSWADRVGGRFVGGQEGADPASVAYDAVESARNRNAGIVLVDTAGRLHTRRDLMEELEKIDRVTGRLVEGAPHERLLVVDGTSGQNVV
ncbi:MAG: signal recognition particle receptor subunit alpha, partial [Gemmatimonadota bacterium]